MRTRLIIAIILGVAPAALADEATAAPLPLTRITALEKEAHDDRIVGSALLGCGIVNLAASIALGVTAGIGASRANDHNDAGPASMPFAFGAVGAGLTGAALSIVGIHLLVKGDHAKRDASTLRSGLKISVTPESGGAAAHLALNF